MKYRKYRIEVCKCFKNLKKNPHDNHCSDKKDEASAETSSDDDSDDDDDEEEDLIGEKGKAPNTLLMEVQIPLSVILHLNICGLILLIIPC